MSSIRIRKAFENDAGIGQYGMTVALRRDFHETRWSMVDLEVEAAELTDLLRGKVVKIIRRHRVKEILIEFEDGWRLYVDNIPDGLEFSVTGGEE
jgi:hypothetical protein